MTSITRRATVAVCGGLVASAAFAAVPATAAASSGQHQAALTVHVDRSGVNASRQVVRPGRVHIRNRGHRPVMVMTPLHGSTVATLVADSVATDAPGETSAATAKLFHDFAIDALVTRNADVYLPVSRGSLFLFDAKLDKLTAGDVTTVAVRGKRAAGSVPHSATVHIVRGGGLAPIKHSVARTGYVHLINGSRHPQVLMLAAVRKTASAADVRHLLRHPSNIDYELAVLDIGKPIRIIAYLSAHRAAWNHYSVSAGRFLLMTVDAQQSNGNLLGKRGHVRLLVTR